MDLINLKTAICEVKMCHFGHKLNIPVKTKWTENVSVSSKQNSLKILAKELSFTLNKNA